MKEVSQIIRSLAVEILKVAKRYQTFNFPLEKKIDSNFVGKIIRGKASETVSYDSRLNMLGNR